jgi:hypothetical protein
LLLCGITLALTGAAAAEPVGPANAVADGLPPNRIMAIVRATGFDPMGRPVRNGDLYTVRALDPNDIAYRLVIDAHSGRTVSMRQIAMPGPYQAFPGDGRNMGPIFGRIFGPPGDDGFGTPRPPRDLPHAKPSPPQPEAVASLPHQQDAVASPPHSPQDAGAPLPRPRPYFLEATGSIPQTAPPPAPSVPQTAAVPQVAPESQKAPEPPKDNGGAEMPPIAPLD